MSTTPSRANEDLWQLIPSSPLQPPSSPAAEKDRFLTLPEKAYSRRSLEYACANARAGPARVVRPLPLEMEEDDDDKFTLIGRHQAPALEVGLDWADARNKENIEGTIRRLNMDVEAAMVLLGFQKQSP